MPRIAATAISSISALKQSPARIIEEAGAGPVAILNHNKPVAYLVAPDTYERMLEALADHEDMKRVLHREGQEVTPLIPEGAGEGRYRLGFVEEAMREWQGLAPSVRQPFERTLAKRLEEPHVERQRFPGLPGFYRIKLKKSGSGPVYVLVYKVEGERIEVREVGTGREDARMDEGV
ncbi:prevent-host-death family protein [Parvibaculum lavamentivorans DS-1]|uniref:Antitoxin n=1 Tax=Parvibaculum lavamentivorans (strain DS-1 / DSM 13023 / NCIMB 13966) TaxID=402881 RepID=A7HZ68_PARL1|nr:type II toxin-antitoxin system Phd/YefM family antitoxin [Parvibaculum lavamentivorans]ABS65201.1 prevent-host-death family protein [Parvibaculum lavamentivorans DS-1]